MMRTRIIVAAIIAAAPLALPASSATAMRSTTLQEERCDVQARVGNRLETVEMPELHVLAQTGQGRFSPDLPRGAGAIVCVRTSVLPAAHDDEALATGLPLFIVELSAQRRTGVLEIAGGVYRYRLTEGRLAPDEQGVVASTLGQYQARAQARLGSASQQ